MSRSRCDTCGIGYTGRRLGERCGDRSTSARRAVLAAREGRRAVVLPCHGLLVTHEQYRMNRE